MIIGSKEMERILNPESVEYILTKMINPKMSMLNVFRKQNNYGEKTFQYHKRKRNTEMDIAEGVLPEPVPITEGSSYPQVSFTSIEEEYGNLTKFGFEVEFSKETVEDKRNLAFIQDCLRQMGYSIERMINRFAYRELINSAGIVDPIDLSDGAWSKPEGNEGIDEDVTSLKRVMEDQSGYEDMYQLTDMYMSKNSYYGAEDLYNILKAPNTFNGVGNSVNFHKTREFASDLLGIDLLANPAIWYFNLQEGDNRLHDPNNQASSILNVHYFTSDDSDKYPHSLGYQISVILGLAVNKENCVIYQRGV